MRKVTKYAKENRKKPTPAEKQLKKLLLCWHIKFRTQRMMDFYIVDFLIPERWLIVELDGKYHNNPQQRSYDKRRNEYLQKKGFSILRFWNEKVFKQPESIKQSILNVLLKPPPKKYKDLYGKAEY
ncbi:unnamed protein product [marine sediment metagenome]|uniref:DUF559 domain-containing protein n=1 Tax=marine sediment metagenome TaxID=412755 RepID=X1KHG0_9ZZZZ